MKKLKKQQWARVLLGVLAVVLVGFAFFSAVRNLDRDSSGAEREQLEKIVRRTVAACYAAEGEYPADLKYLQDNYGLIIDGERYVVKYNAFAENMMPEITVLEKNR